MNPAQLFNPKARRASEMAYREALSLGHNYIGPEHLLLGLARLEYQQQDNETAEVVVRAMRALGLDSENIRNAVVAEMTRCPTCKRVGKS